MTDEIDTEVVVETGAAAPPRVHEMTPEMVPAADFSRREFALRELMDEPCTYADYSAAALDLAKVNRLTRGYRPTLEFLGRVLERTGVTHEPLHVVDVGCGHGDGLRTICRWAAKRSVPLRLTGIDLNPYAARLAKECDRREHVSAGTIAWVTGDVFATKLERPADVVVSSLLAHHLCDEDVVRLLQWKEAQARVGWLVSDLRRSEHAAKVFGGMARVMRWDSMIARDGVVSFRRAMSVEEWGALVGVAGIQEAGVREAGMGRLVVERIGLGSVR
jgi:SAM-dependent methyltransferase